jgi:PST family polysaccharide transporter
MLISFINEKIDNIRCIISISLLVVLGDALFPAWLFQGMETMGVITRLRMVAKVSNLILVFFIVRGPDNLLFVPAIEAITSVGAAVFSIYIAKRRFGIYVMRPRILGVYDQLRDGGHIFVSIIAVQFYTTINMIVLGLLSGSASVGTYAIAEKVYSALRGLLGPFVQATFPSMARIHDSSYKEFARRYFVILRVLIPLLCIIGLCLFAMARPLIQLASGRDAEEAINTLRVFAIAFPFALGSFLSPMLVVRGRSATLMWITIVGGLIGAISSPVLSYGYGAPGAAVSFLIVQIYNSTFLVLANRSQNSDKCPM